MEGLIGNITIETTLSKPINFDIELTEDAEPSMVMQFLKPKITVLSPFGKQKFAPYGEPDSELRGVFGVAFLALGFMTISLIIFKMVK